MRPTVSKPPSIADWSAGRYEHTARNLLGAAQVLVDRAAPQPGECVADVGCGTGSVALLAAAAGASVVGIDPAPRLLEVARADTAERGLEAKFIEGHAADLPLSVGSADLVLSSFGLIFAPDPVAAAVELSRVAAPSACIAFTAWVPEGPLAEMGHAIRASVASVIGRPAGPPPFAWHDQAQLRWLFGRHGFEITVEQHEIQFTAASPAAYVDSDLENHPLAVSGRELLESHGELQPLRERLLTIFTAANQEPAAFRISAPYVVVTAERGSAVGRS